MTVQAIKLDRILYRMQNREFHRLFARFHSVRWMHRNVMKLGGAFGPDASQSTMCDSSHQLFGVGSDNIVRNLRENGLASGLQLPKTLVDDILDHSRSCLPEIDLSEDGNYQPPQHYDVKEPQRIDSVRAVAQDPVLVRVATNYLGYKPRLQSVRLWWLAPYSQQPAGAVLHPSHLHWDIWSYNGASAFFYLTDVKPQSGAHVIVKGSHNWKPRAWHFGSSEQPYSTILDYYPESDVAVIEGQAGTGFIEDPFCIHGTMPCYEKRLMLQVRYI